MSSCNDIVRLARRSDAAKLLALVKAAGSALERISPEAAAIESLLALNERSLSGEASAAEEGYLFLLEDPVTNTLLGCAALQCRIGLEEPFYDYRAGQIVHSSRQLKSYRCLDVLYLCNDLTGASEVHSFYLTPAARRQNGGQMLLKALALFIAVHPERFAPRLIIELRGTCDAIGASPFWEAVGRHFFKVDQRAAERLVAQGHKAFIAELMPKFPVYVTLLPESAQNAVAEVHVEVRPLLADLEHEGFHYESHIDIFDGGRVMEAHTHELASIVGSTCARIVTSAKAAENEAALFWIAIGEGDAFQLLMAEGHLNASDPTQMTLRLPSSTSAAAGHLAKFSGEKIRLLRT